MHAEFGEDIAQVNLDGVDAEEQLRGDLFVAQAGRQQLEDFEFTLAEFGIALRQVEFFK